MLARPPPGPAAPLRSLPPQKPKPLSWNHWQWRLGQSLVARIPALRRRCVVYGTIASAYEGAEVEGFTDEIAMPEGEPCERFRTRSAYSLDSRVTRRVNRLILRNKTVLGATGRVVDEGAETLLRFMNGRDHVTRNDFTLAPMRPVDRPGGLYVNLLGELNGHRQLFHFVFERLQSLYYFLKRFDPPREEVHVLVRPDMPDYQRRVLDVIAGDHPFLRFATVRPGERWRVGTLIHVDVARNATSALVDKGFLAFMGDCYLRAFAVDPEPQARRRIFISREDAKQRRFSNADAVHRVIERHGFEPVLAARLGFREQIETFRDAAAIIGAHGAGLTNMIFAPARAPLIELLPEDRMFPCYLQLALSAGRPYHFLRGGMGDRRQDFRVDPEELDAVLGAVLPASPDSG